MLGMGGAKKVTHMKWWILAAVTAVGVALFAGKDDIRRYRRIKRM
jgi:hypothetical protein